MAGHNPVIFLLPPTRHIFVGVGATTHVDSCAERAPTTESQVSEVEAALRKKLVVREQYLHKIDNNTGVLVKQWCFRNGLGAALRGTGGFVSDAGRCELCHVDPYKIAPGKMAMYRHLQVAPPTCTRTKTYFKHMKNETFGKSKARKFRWETHLIPAARSWCVCNM